ncbi:WD repeat-containing protein 87 [Cladochytrium tenue]|nr:WD repeat-containing protein 87 [Cladochytrium tenue]
MATQVGRPRSLVKQGNGRAAATAQPAPRFTDGGADDDDDDGDYALLQDERSRRIRFLTAREPSAATTGARRRVAVGAVSANPVLDEIEDGLLERQWRRRRQVAAAAAEGVASTAANVALGQYRRHQTGTRVRNATGAHPVLPWAAVRRALVALAKSGVATTAAAVDGDEDDDDDVGGGGHYDDGPRGNPSAAAVVAGDGVGAWDGEESRDDAGGNGWTTLGCGFQLEQRVAAGTRERFRNVLHLAFQTGSAASASGGSGGSSGVGGGEQFATLDARGLSVWGSGGELRMRAAVAGPMAAAAAAGEGGGGAPRSPARRAAAMATVRGALVGLIQRWVWAEKLHVAVCYCKDRTLQIFDYQAALRLNLLKDTHSTSVTCCVFYEPTEYLITACKGGELRIWNSQGSLVNELVGHFRPVTGLALLERASGMASGTQQVALSSSLDKTVRVWSFAVGTCLHRLDVGAPILGMRLARKDAVLVHCERAVEVWRMQRTHRSFLHTGFGTAGLQRVERGTAPARLVAVGSDGGVRLVSPRSGAVLVTGFPTFKDASAIEVVYDWVDDLVYVRLSSGDFVVYDCRFNPMRAIELWRSAEFSESLTCVTGIIFHPPDRHKQFYLVSGAENGQLLCLDRTNKGRPELLVQAHGARVAAVRFDDKKELVVSTRADLQFKLWRVTISSGTGNAVNFFASGLPSTPLSIALEAKATFDVATFGIRALAQRPIFELNMEFESIAVVVEGGLAVIGYEGTAIAMPRDESSRSSKIVALAAMVKYNHWATADDDDTVRIWDSHGGMVREIQFNSTVTSVAFANERGDLLAALGDHVAVVWVQEFLPQNLARVALRRGGFGDDEAEAPMPFDSNADFWACFYEEENKRGGGGGGEVRWHVAKNAVMPRAVASGTGGDLIMKADADEESIRMRRNRRLALEKEAELYRRAAGYEERHAMTSRNAAHARAFTPIPMAVTRRESTEDVDALGEDFEIIRIDSETSLLPTGVLDLTSPPPESDQIPLSHSEEKDKAEVQPDPVCDPAPKPKEKDETKPMAILPPERIYKKVKAAEMEKRREIIRRRLQASGIALPNSVVKKDTPVASEPAVVPRASVARDKPDRVQALLSKAKERGPGLRLNPIPKYVNQSRPISNVVGKPGGQPEILPVREYDIKHRESIASDDQLQVLSSRFMVDLADTAEEENEEVQDGDRAGRLVDGSNVAGLTDTEASDLVLDGHIGVNEGSPISTPTSPVDERASPRKKQRRPVVQPGRNRRDRHVPAQGAAPGRLSADRGEAAVAVTDGADSRLATHARRSGSSGHAVRLPSAAASAREDSVGNSRPPNAGGASLAAWSEDAPSTSGDGGGRGDYNDDSLRMILPEAASNRGWEGEEVAGEAAAVGSELKNPEDVSLPEMEAYAWELLRTRKLSGAAEVLSRITSKFWFPGVKGGEVTLASVVQALLELIRNGMWSEQCEASKALLYLFKTFEHDFPRPLELLVRPQLEVLHSSEHWQVRAQLCLNVAGYGLHNDDGDGRAAVVCALAGRLRDRNEEVRRCAFVALAACGIGSKGQLLAALQTAGIVPRSTSAPDALDRMLSEARESDAARAAEASQAVLAWYDGVGAATAAPPPPHAQVPAPLRRQDSYREHLAGKFFPPDGSGPRAGSARWRGGARRGRPASARGGSAALFDIASAGGAASVFDGVSEGWDARSERSGSARAVSARAASARAMMATGAAGTPMERLDNATLRPRGSAAADAAWRRQRPGREKGGGRDGRGGVPSLRRVASSVRAMSAGWRECAGATAARAAAAAAAAREA